MELEKAKENDNLALNEKSMELLQKCHEKVLEIKLPEKPRPLPKSFVLGWIDNPEKEFWTSMGAILPSGAVFVASGLFDDFAGMTLAVGGGIGILSASINAFSAAEENSFAYRLQKLWRRKGLPARKLQALEKKQAEEMEEYLQQMSICQKKVAKINKQVQPELKRVNAQSKEFVFEFGMDGLVASRRKDTAAHSSFVRLAKEIGV